jgi:hypothetical protein
MSCSAAEIAYKIAARVSMLAGAWIFACGHNSVIWDSYDTTCKYLHRKDLPKFVVDESMREHAAEFAEFSGMVRLHSRQAINLIYYSQKFAWERRIFDPLTNVLAQYHKSGPALNRSQAELMEGGRWYMGAW